MADYKVIDGAQWLLFYVDANGGHVWIQSAETDKQRAIEDGAARHGLGAGARCRGVFPLPRMGA